MAESAAPQPLRLDLLTMQLAPSDRPPLDAIDPRLEEISGLVTKGEYLQAAAGAERLWVDGFYDVRVIGTYLYGVFLEQGFPGIPVVFQGILQLLTVHWSLVGPPDKKEHFADVALQWLFKTLVRQLEHLEKSKDAQWRTWSEGESRLALQETIELCPDIEMALTQTFKEPRSLSRFHFLRTWLRELQRTTATQIVDIRHESGDAQDLGAEGEGQAQSSGEVVSAPPAVPGVPAVENSPALMQLLQKLEAFAELVERQDFVRAAVIATDVEQVLASFDPRVYLPKLFSRYFLLFSQNVESIEPYLGAESLSFKVLTELYRVDLDAFRKG